MNSIRRHLTLTLAAALGGLLTVSGILVWVLVRRALTEQFDATLLAAAQTIAAGTEEDDGELEVDFDLLQLDGFDVRDPQAFYELRDPTGKLVERSSALKRFQLPALPLPKGDRPEFHALTLDNHRPARAVTFRFDPDDDKEKRFRNSVMVTIYRSDSLRAATTTLGFVLAGTGLVALLLLVPLIRLALTRGLRPLTDLTRRAAGIDAQKLDTRLPADTAPAELRPITATLNALLARLEDSFARERRFSSDVAHELRTPLAELQSLAELASRWPDQATPEAFAEVRAITEEMSALVATLTALSRAESGAEPVARESVALHELVGEALDRLEEVATQRKLRVVRRIDPCVVETDPAHWRIIAGNLLGNAFHHAPEGSDLRVSLRDGVFAVGNPAPALAPEDLPQLHERFWRKDAARTGYGHSGLGLSLVQTLAGILGLRVEATLEKGWLTMRVAPTADAQRHG